MVTSAAALKKYGDPNLLETQNKHFELWIVPSEIREAFNDYNNGKFGTLED